MSHPHTTGILKEGRTRGSTAMNDGSLKVCHGKFTYSDAQHGVYFSKPGNLVKSIANNTFLSYEKSVLYISF